MALDITKNKNDLVSVREMDFLEQDPPLRGQNYVCLSFVSPEDVIKRKEVFMFEEFLKSFSDDVCDWFGNMTAKYPAEKETIDSLKERYSYIFDRNRLSDEFDFFRRVNSSKLEDEYYKQNDFQTSIRGLKVRGVFDTLREAEVRAQVLKRVDDKFSVYVAQVGCWCPWSPNPDDITDQEYAETHLNTMMKKYKENQDKRDSFYLERKRDLQVAASTKQSANIEKEESVSSSEPVHSKIADEDPWMAKKTAEAGEHLPYESEVDASETTPLLKEDKEPPVA